MEERFAKFTAKVESDKEFAQKLFALENPEDVQAFLKAEGIDFTLEDIEIVRKGVLKAVEKGSGQLSDDELEEVAGGIVITAAGVTAAAALITAIGGVAIGGAGALFAGVDSAVRSRW